MCCINGERLSLSLLLIGRCVASGHTLVYYHSENDEIAKASIDLRRAQIFPVRNGRYFVMRNRDTGKYITFMAESDESGLDWYDCCVRLHRGIHL